MLFFLFCIDNFQIWLIILRIIVIVQPVKKIIPKALSDGYLQEVKRIASKQISTRQGGFKRNGWIIKNHLLFELKF